MRTWQKRYVPDRHPRMELSQMEIMLEMIAFCGLIFQVLLIIKWWSLLPSTVPTHFGTTGIPDAWGDKSSLLLLPIISGVLYVILGVLSRFPRLYNYPFRITAENYLVQYLLARTLLAGLKAEIMWVFAYLTYQTILNSLGLVPGLAAAFLPFTMTIIFCTIGIYYFQAYQSK